MVTVGRGDGPRIQFRAGTLTRSGPYRSLRSITELTDAEIAAMFADTVPTVTIEQMRIYRAGEHDFFDELVSLVTAFSSLMLGLTAHHHGSVQQFGSFQGIGMHGSRVSGVALTLLPRPLLDALVQGQWPTEVRLVETPLARMPPEEEGPLVGAAKVLAVMATGAFVRFYESAAPEVRQRATGNVENWPPEWNFARVVRNALVHDGRILFTNSAAPAVTWRSVSYSPADNGREILFTDLTAVELILLMDDLGERLKELRAA